MMDLYMWGTANGLRAAVALAECGLAARVSVCGGTGARAIADAARLWVANLVIVAAHDFGGPPAEVGNLARAVMRRAAVPVLTCRPPVQTRRAKTA